jgi:hypothetical protein
MIFIEHTQFPSCPPALPIFQPALLLGVERPASGKHRPHWPNEQEKKIYFSSPNFHQNPLLLPQLQNRTNNLPQLFKPCILSPASGFEGGFLP